ncbi:hypothetical protein M2152_002595 [Microbacteriaceae bacterium SG_E_30_P1]|uniref:Uncharacterized protein n=1 Tax=Antiquaquibacter oligotrophicus TaxID=2880260 RepID=A0ABT6KR19_9MICO|nr:hypothetical protein [Antiquaquibacter oligotrophicus]MDH6182413.1 hypothetical protein [Antiquaquibacter oligotrophicus]UDF14615.1 hypothetical protein LH407_07070 [Antiquaquibacter oligotrophicus]
MRWNPLRITQRRWKAAYVVAGVIVMFVLVRSLVGLPVWTSTFLIAAIEFAIIYGATRVFRGRDEVIEPPRDWWRLTARPRAGFALAVLFFIPRVVVNVVLVIVEHEWSLIVYVIEDAALAALYLGSSTRLLRENLRRRNALPPRAAAE